MFYAKLHFVVTVMLTQAAALLDPASTLPFFPIEISRTAASSVYATAILQVGAFLMAWLIPSTIPAVVLWCGFSLVALIPDTVHRNGHRAGVMVALLGALGQAPYVPYGWLIFFLGGVTHALHVGCKVVALVVWEGKRAPRDVMQRHDEIMYTRGATVTPRVLNVFRLGGVLQWTSFVILSLLF